MDRSYDSQSPKAAEDTNNLRLNLEKRSEGLTTRLVQVQVPFAHKFARGFLRLGAPVVAHQP